MAKITGVFTGMKGKLGNAVLQTWKGIQVIRTHVIPANPQSTAQTINRTLLNNFVQMFKPVIEELVHKFWNPFVTAKQTGWGNLIGANQLEQSGGVIDYEDVILSKGSLPGESITSCTYDSATGAILTNWLDSDATGSSPADLVQVCAFIKNTGKWAFSLGTDVRDDETVSFNTVTGLTPADITVYLFFFTMNAGATLVELVSDSDAQEAVASP